MESDVIFLDSSLFKAVRDEQDEFYQLAKPLWDMLLENKTTLVTNNFILDETYTLLRAKCGKKKALELRRVLLAVGDQLQIERVTVEDEAEAWTWFEKDWRGLSFTDCVCFAMMKRLGIQQVATFNERFREAGFVCFP